MKREEQIAYEYLTSLDRGEVLYEPDGNVPPDFSIAKTIGVEVRRLNQNFHYPDGARGLEEDRIPLHSRLKKLGQRYGPSKSNRSFYFSVWYRRPIPSWREIEIALRDIFATSALYEQRTEVKIDRNFKVRFQQRREVHSQEFIFASATDQDSTTFVLPALTANIRHCIAEKTEKCSAYWKAYKEWWLVLIDHIDFAQSAEIDVNIAPWAKIVLISPYDNHKAIDLKPTEFSR